MTVGCDIDGVTADFISEVRPHAAKLLDVEASALTPEPDWDFDAWGLGRRGLLEAYEQAALNGLWRDAPVIDGAVDGLFALRAAGALVRFITARPEPLGERWRSKAIGETCAWLVDARLLPLNVRAGDTVFTDDKPAVGCDIYIDDAPHHIAALQQAGLAVVVFSHVWNRGVDDRGLRVSGWSEVLETLTEWWQTRRAARPAAPLVI